MEYEVGDWVNIIGHNRGPYKIIVSSCNLIKAVNADGEVLVSPKTKAYPLTGGTTGLFRVVDGDNQWGVE